MFSDNGFDRVPATVDRRGHVVDAKATAHRGAPQVWGSASSLPCRSPYRVTGLSHTRW
nr:hypothetical protein [Kibdelosporangium sp. MJ126-NF4]